METGDEVDIKSPNRPYYYPSNFQCTWQLSAVDKKGSFAIHFKIFNTKSESDHLTIGRGIAVTEESIVGKFFSWISSNFVAVTGEQDIWMIFQSDFARSGDGFELYVERIGNTGMVP